jgi:putative inorganic carbon (HCO3(-)) transporter
MTLGMRLRAALTWLADWQIIPVGFLAPIFMLADRLPNGVVALAVLGILPLWGIQRVVRGRFFTPTPVDIPLLVLAVTLPVGIWASAVPALSLPPLLQVLFGLTLFYALVNSLTSARKVELAGWVMLAGTALLAGLGLVGTAWGAGAKFLPVDLSQRIPHLIGAFWYSAGFHPNIVGGALAALVPLTAAYAWSARTWPRRLLLWLLLLIESFTLVLTQSRGALMGLVVALAVVAIGRNRRWAWLVLFLAVIVALIVVFSGVSPSLESVIETAGTSAALSSELRLELVSRGVYMLQDFPLTGIGLGMFPRVLPILYPLFVVGAGREVTHVHNLYLQTGIEHGIPGLIAFFAFIILLWVIGIQAIRSSRGRPWEPLAIGLLAGLAAYCTHGMLDAIWRTPFQGLERDAISPGCAVERSRVVPGTARHRLAGTWSDPAPSALGLVAGSSRSRNAYPVDKRNPLALALLAPLSAADWTAICHPGGCSVGQHCASWTPWTATTSVAGGGRRGGQPGYGVGYLGCRKNA